MATFGFCRLWTFGDFVFLEPEAFKPEFVEGWPGPFSNGSGSGAINETTFDWATENVPFFETDDADIQTAYYFRAKTYHSHMIPTECVHAV